MKVYVAKSNKANPDYLLQIRNFLSKFKTVEILEFTGGKYNNRDLINSDLLIVIPDLSEPIVDDEIPLGKGLYMQIDDFLLHNSIDCIMIVTGVDINGNIQYSSIRECDDEGDYDDTYMTVLDENNFIEYGSVNVHSNSHSLYATAAEIILLDEAAEDKYSESEADALWNTFVLRNAVNNTNNDYKYLLIKR